MGGHKPQQLWDRHIKLYWTSNCKILRHRTYTWKKNQTASIQRKHRFFYFYFFFFFFCFVVVLTSGSSFMFPGKCKRATKPVAKTAGQRSCLVIFSHFINTKNQLLHLQDILVMFKSKLFVSCFVLFVYFNLRSRSLVTSSVSFKTLF